MCSGEWQHLLELHQLAAEQHSATHTKSAMVGISDNIG